MANESVQKNGERELPVPTAWREPLMRIADQIVLGNAPKGLDIRPIESNVLEINLANVRDYPEKIGPIAGNTWNSSIYVWMDDYWQVLLDLTEEDGKTSDLVLHVQVYELSDNYEFEIGLIYVP